MKPEKRHLIHDLLDEGQDARQEATLLAGASILRRRRWRRVALRSAAAVILFAFAALSLQRMVVPRTPVLTAAPVQPDAARSLTDAELLALFPDTPVGLVTFENGRKRLIFPRPGDEERFLKRL